MLELSTMQKLAVWALPVLFAITLHEVAHGWAARRLGDPTAMMLGRLSLNPLRHIDPIGTVLLPGIMLMIGGFVFGWAKPVPVTWENLRHPKRDMAWVAIAGPMANLLMALAWALILKIGQLLQHDVAWLALPMMYMGGAGIFFNVLLMVLNLLPLPPLDGGRILSALLPGPWSYQLNRLEPYGIFVLLGLLITGILGKMLIPPIQYVQSIILALFGL